MNVPQLQFRARLLITLQIVVATTLLALGEGSPVILIATLAVIGVSTFFTDLRGWFRLNQPVADSLALLIMVVVGVMALRIDRQGLLVLVANLQAYLQYVLFFQPKTPRIYWQLALLSLGQMAIASTLVPGPIFGVMLFVYILLGTVGFALLLMAGESARFDRTPPQPVSPSGPLVFIGGAAPVEQSVLWRGLLPGALLICLLTSVSGGALFFVLPRWGTGGYEVVDGEPLQTVGFTSTVILGELGEVINNPDVVMRVTFYRGRGDQPIRLEGEPLFRGTVVTRYEDRVWSYPFPTYQNPLPSRVSSTVTRQRISIEPLDVSDVFHLPPAVALDQVDSGLRLDSSTNQLLRPDEMRLRTREYDIGTTGLRGNRQREVLPCIPKLNSVRLERMLEPFDGENPDAELFPAIRELASRILRQQGLDPNRDRVAAARALSDHFRLSGEFFYSLDRQERNLDLDPLEDFISLNTGGHCEYFAGALVLMLRSQGIPARMVIGFKGGEWNDVGQYYQVQQLHAHAWVEAYLESEHIAPEEFDGEQQPPAAWLVLDPTEGTREGTLGSQYGMIAKLRQAIDYAHVLWINYVASLNAKRQRQGIYEPAAAGIEAAFENLTSAQVWDARMAALKESPLGEFWYWYRRHWFSWRGGLVAVGFSGVLVSAFLTLRLLLRRLRQRGWLGNRGAAAEAPVLEMYRRLEAALGQLGLRRDPAQTAHEFAMAAAGQLAERGDHRPLAPLPRRVVAAFYRVRFGGRTLDKSEAEAVEHALTELEIVLSRSR